LGGQKGLVENWLFFANLSVFCGFPVSSAIFRFYENLPLESVPRCFQNGLSDGDSAAGVPRGARQKAPGAASAWRLARVGQLRLAHRIGEEARASAGR
jgi:hypothetical protein